MSERPFFVPHARALGGEAFVHRNLPDALADHIVTMVATGELVAGERIFEQALADRLGVSRAPLREALRILQTQGVVRSEPNRGAFISHFGSGEMMEVLAVRQVVETAALRRLMARAQSEPAMLDAFEGPIEAMRRAALTGDRLAYCRGDLEFHACLLRLSGSTMLKPIWDLLSRDILVFLMQERDADYDYQQSVADHERLLGAMRRGDRREIERELAEHIGGAEARAAARRAAERLRAAKPSAGDPG